MEYWKIKTDDGLISISDPCHHLKKSSHSDIPINPTLQYSNIPIGGSRHSQFSLTPDDGIYDCPRGPSFRC